MTKRKGVWDLQQVRDKYLQDIWVQETWVYGMGQTYYYQLGNPGSGTISGLAPRLQTYPNSFTTNSTPGSKWKRMSSGFVSMGCMVWDEDDNAYVFGNNRHAGGLGLNESSSTETTPILLPAGSGRTWEHCHMADGGGWAVKDDGTLWSWGYNERGDLGHNDTVARSSPVQVGTDTTWSNAYGSLNTGGSGYNAREVLAIKTNGTLWAWGYNNAGQLGLNNKTSYSSPVQVGTSTDWGVIANGGRGAIKTDGTMWVWGPGWMGQLGLNQGNGNGGNPGGDYSSPKQIPGTNWSRLARSISNAAIKTDGTLWVWGWNDNGALGLNTEGAGAPYYGTQYSGSRSSPTQLGGATNWTLVSAGAVKDYGGRAGNSDGEMWGWGQAGSNGFGNNSPTSSSQQYSSPVQALGSGTDVKFSNTDNTYCSMYYAWNALVDKIPASDM